MLIAITRAVSPSLVDCALTHVAREPIDVARAIEQHADYERLLASLGATIVRAPAAPDLPDAVFVEDVAIVLDEVAVVTRPGAVSRRGEPATVASTLAGYRRVLTMDAPATLDGGDVLRIGRTLHVGRSSRTNDSGIELLRALVAPYGYDVVAVDFSGCLHLKSAATAVTNEAVLMNPAWVSAEAFPDVEPVLVDEREPHAANALRVGDAVVHPTQYPRTRERLEQRGVRVAPIECGEIIKAEGAVTCCSLVFEAAARALPRVVG